MALASLLRGRLSDKIGTRILYSLGLITITIGLFSLTIIIKYFDIIYIIFSQFIVELGVGLFSSPNQSAIMRSVKKKDLGIVADIRH